jgi:nicotinate-nucleotide pyrophosphorylase (carboxylating)
MKTAQRTFTIFSRIPRTRLQRLITAALEEDIGQGDLTTELLVPPEFQATATLTIKQEGVLAGTEVFAETFAILNDDIEIDVDMPDGSLAKAGDVAIRLRGPAAPILTGERTALNFMQKMSGVATATSRLAEIGARHGVRVNHIRKTTPLLRDLEVYAVKVGGGSYNRYGLFDGILIKDNHLVVARKLGLSVEQLVARYQAEAPMTVKVGLEVKHLNELPAAIRSKPDYIALDNMSVDEMKAAVREIDGRILIDVTGGVNASNLEAIATTGIQVVGVGGITHSAPSLDMSLNFELE